MRRPLGSRCTHSKSSCKQEQLVLQKSSSGRLHPILRGGDRLNRKNYLLCAFLAHAKVENIRCGKSDVFLSLALRCPSGNYRHCGLSVDTIQVQPAPNKLLIPWATLPQHLASGPENSDEFLLLATARLNLNGKSAKNKIRPQQHNAAQIKWFLIYLLVFVVV